MLCEWFKWRLTIKDLSDDFDNNNNNMQLLISKLTFSSFSLARSPLCFFFFSQNRFLILFHIFLSDSVFLLNSISIYNPKIGDHLMTTMYINRAFDAISHRPKRIERASLAGLAASVYTNTEYTRTTCKQK